MNAEKPRISFSYAWWAVLSLVFFGIPIFLGCIGMGQVLKEREERRFQRIDRNVDVALSRIDRHRDTSTAFKQLLLEMTGKVFAAPRPVEEMRRLKSRLQKRFPGVLEFILLDSRGGLVPEVSDGKPSRYVLEKLFQACRALGNRDRSLLNQHWSKFQVFLGPMVKREDLDSAGDMFLATHKKSRTFVFVSGAFPQGQIVAFLHQVPDWHYLMLIDRVTQFNRKSRWVKAGIYDQEKPLDNSPLLRELPSDQVKSVLEEFRGSTRSQKRIQGYSWGERMSHPTIRVLACSPIAESADIRRLRIRVVGLLSILFGILSVLALKYLQGAWDFYLSIRWKLVLLFAYSASVPLSVMGINALDYLSERHQGFEAHAHQEMEQRLKVFDKKVYSVYGIIQTYLKKVICRPFPSGADLLTPAVTVIKRAQRRVRPSTLLLIDEGGRSVYELDKGDSERKKRSNKLLLEFYSQVLKSMNNPEESPEEAMNSKVSQMAAVGGIDMDAIFSDVVRSMMTVRNYSYGSRKAVQAIFPMFDAEGKARFLAVFAWMQFNLNKQYVAAFLDRASRELSETRLFAYNCHYPGESTPKNFPLLPLISGFVERLKTQTVLREKLARTNETWLLTGIKGEEMPEYLLVAITSDRQIRRELFQLKKRLGAISLALMAISIVVGGLLAQSFLRPVGHLADGVEALRRRDFRERIPVGGRDEFGDLSLTFNEMMESLEDLETARVVQEALFPLAEIRAGNIALFGKCVPATQVGGDYFDYFLAATGNPVLIIGDVAGHGVSAAIVMGMAKALVAHPGTAHDPASVLSVLNKVITDTLKRKKMMTCFCGMVDVPAKTFVFANAGHNFPLLVRDGACLELKNINFLLGIGARAKYANIEEPLRTGDWILFYTDGLIEARARTGKMIGYERLLEALPTLKRGTPKETEQAIRAWYDHQVAPGPQEDDITLLVLQVL